jgi:mono/diheme cytochrome c family protein
MWRICTSSVLFLTALVGCERPHSDMGEQDKHLPYSKSEFFADGASARPVVAGTVAREVEDEGPARVSAETVARGQVGFDAYCSVCHGRLGNGEGMVVQRGFTRPPSFHVDRLRNAPDAHIYEVITRGYGAMFGYAERVRPAERWEIVAYIRALQMAGEGATEEARAALVARGDRPAPATMKGGVK